MGPAKKVDMPVCFLPQYSNKDGGQNVERECFMAPLLIQSKYRVFVIDADKSSC